MSARQRTSFFIASVVLAGWIVTWIFGRAAVAQRIFDTEIYSEAAHLNRSSYTRVSPNAESLSYPYYSTSTWSPFPCVIVADYGVMWGFSGGHGGRRVYLWFLGPIASFAEYHRWDS